ncbi:MAG: dioxygenase [Ectothiorhodospiraceae bacterium]|nr:dioxygenase [Ectothiorhodospiraceae bacterium]
MQTTLPTLFISHGSPMHAIEAGAPGRAWQAMAQSLPRPRAVLMVSAHWESALAMIGAAAAPETIHDFGGFPPELYRLRYPAPGAPEVAREIATRLEQAGICAGLDGLRGLDHGAWCPLLHMYPRADVPVLQLSVQPALGSAHHLAVGRALTGLGDAGVLVIGSGHATHNLRDWMRGPRDAAPLPYARAFAQWMHDCLLRGDGESLVDWHQRAPSAQRAHPSDEHYLPLLVAYGAAGPRPRATRFVDSFDGPALAMDAYRFDPQ